MGYDEKIAEIVRVGGFAHPVSVKFAEGVTYTDLGMTLRDAMAIAALPAVIEHCQRERWAWAAKRSYEIADAMLAERQKPVPEPEPEAEAIALARRVAALNPEAGEIGPGMLASLVEDAKRVLGE